MFEEIYQVAFRDELEKIADMLLGPSSGRVVSGGIFAHGDEKNSQERAREIAGNLTDINNIGNSKDF